MKKVLTTTLFVLISSVAIADKISDAEKQYQSAQEALAKAQEQFIQSQLAYDKVKNEKESLEEKEPRHAAAWTPTSWLKALKSMPKGDAARGEVLSKKAYCGTCHGEKGIPQTDNAPAIADQVPAFIYKSLLDYKSGLLHIDGKSLAMTGAAKALSKQNMADLAIYYSQQKMPVKKLSGKRPNIPLIAGMCAGCHGRKGEGGANNSGPALRHLNRYYLNRHLKAFQKGQRQSEVNHMMQSMMSSLSDKQIDEIVAYLSAI